MDDTLRRFNGDPHTKAALKDFIDSFIQSEAVRMMYAREDVSAIPDAHNLINKAFQELEIQYGITERTKAPTNTAK